MYVVKFVLILAAFLASLVLGVVGLSNWIARESCVASWRDSGLQNRYSFWGGCQVRVKDKWIPSSVYREV